MRAVLLLLALLPALGCTEIEDITVNEVITKLEARPKLASGRLAADAASPIVVEICTDEARAPDLDAKLVTSDGAWELPDGASLKTAVVRMSKACEERLLIPPAVSGTIEIAATIKDFSRREPIDLVPACVEKVRLEVQGMLSSAESSMLTVTATPDVEGGGDRRATVGTLVTFDATVAPQSATRYFTEREVRVGDASSVQTTLLVGPESTMVTLTVKASPTGCPEVTSESFVFVPLVFMP